jgi:hypothetical protein
MLPHTSRSPKWSLSFRFSEHEAQKKVIIFFFPETNYLAKQLVDAINMNHVNISAAIFEDASPVYSTL